MEHDAPPAGGAVGSLPPDNVAPHSTSAELREEVAPGHSCDIDAEDTDDNVPDEGGFFEFVNPRALEAVNEEGEEGEEEGQSNSVPAPLPEGEAEFQAFQSATAEPADDGPDCEGDEVSDEFMALSQDEIEAVVHSRMRQLQREYAEVSGAEAGAATAGAATAPPSSTGPGADRMAKLAQLRAALAAARAAAAAAGPRPEPTMELAEGADEFPDDYDSLQALDSAAATAAFVKAPRVPTAPASSTSAAASAVAATASTAATSVSAVPQAPAAAEEFDPFGTGDVLGAPGAIIRPLKAAPARALPGASAAPAVPAPRAPLAPSRAVSPLAASVREEIRSVMSRVKVTVRGAGGAPPAWAEHVVQAAIRSAAAARAVPIGASQATTVSQVSPAPGTLLLAAPGPVTAGV